MKQAPCSRRSRRRRCAARPPRRARRARPLQVRSPAQRRRQGCGAPPAWAGPAPVPGAPPRCCQEWTCCERGALPWVACRSCCFQTQRRATWHRRVGSLLLRSAPALFVCRCAPAPSGPPTLFLWFECGRQLKPRRRVLSSPSLCRCPGTPSTSWLKSWRSSWRSCMQQPMPCWHACRRELT